MMQTNNQQSTAKEILQKVIENKTHNLASKAYQNQLRVMNYSPNTLITYVSWFGMLLIYFPNHKPSKITKDEIMQFLLQCRNTKNRSAAGENRFIIPSSSSVMLGTLITQTFLQEINRHKIQLLQKTRQWQNLLLQNKLLPNLKN